MRHLNGNIPAVIDISITGPEHNKYDIIEVCIIILDNKLYPSQTIFPFNPTLIPQRKDQWDPAELQKNKAYLDQVTKRKICYNERRIYDAALNGIDQMDAADLLMQWFDSLGLKPFKKIVPIAFNWPLIRGFLIDWLGYQTFDIIFEPRYRDIMAMSVYDNDKAWWLNNEYPYPKNNFEFLCSKLGITRERVQRALDDCQTTAVVYRQMISNLARIHSPQLGQGEGE